MTRRPDVRPTQPEATVGPTVQVVPAAPVVPGRNARWLVEWRVPEGLRGDVLRLSSRELRGGKAARAFALGLGPRAVAGEFRLSAPGLPPVVVDLRRLREWDPRVGPPTRCPRALWSLELAEAAAADDLRHAVRAAVATAVAAGVLTAADACGLSRLAWELARR